jgi:cation transport protein ChaC
MREMDLTEELVALCHRPMSDPGPEPGLAYLEEGEYAGLVAQALMARPDDGPIWLFAYGSLIWKPEVPHVEERVAVAHGVHRAFCLTMTRWRGTIEQPGLMMGLLRGGRCTGLALRLPYENPAVLLDRLFRREMTAKPTTYLPRWLRLRSEAGPLTALAFVANPQGRVFAGRLDEAEVARRLAGACGHVGSGADYLFQTVRHLRDRGIADGRLWRLQALVAQAIRDARQN